MIMFIMNRTEQYRLEALMELAHSWPNGRSTAEIASRRGIPAAYLSRLLAELARAGWVLSRRGPNGGVTLAKAPDSISVGSVYRPQGTETSLPPALDRLAIRIDRAVEESIATISLADLASWETVATSHDYSI
jgi:Rrf2 family protein